MVAKTSTSGRVEEVLAVLAERVYDCECALHAARQSRVDAWIGVAADKLHLALLALDNAEREFSASRLANPTAVAPSEVSSRRRHRQARPRVLVS
jgi:hypothetical protein